MTTHLELEDLFGLSVVGDVQLSPDGGSVAFTVSEIDAERDDYRTTIWLAPTGAGEPRRYSHGPGHDTAPRWSPDGRRLAFLSDRDGGQPQLYLLPTGGEARRLTDLEHGAGAAVWAPDGSLMLFSAWVPKEPPDDHRPKVITQAQYKMDSQGYTFGLRDQLFSLSLDSGEVRCLSDGAANDLAPAWSPGGVADFYLSDLWLMAADGSGARQLTSAVGRSLAPAWSPDGSLIACYGTANQGRSWGDPETLLWLVSAESGEARILTLELDRQVQVARFPLVSPPPQWSPAGTALSFPLADAGNVHLVEIDIAGGALRSVVSGERQVISFDRHLGTNRVAFCAADLSHPGEIYLQEGGEERRLTEINTALLAARELPTVERRTFESPHGGTVEGWLLRPRSGPTPGAAAARHPRRPALLRRQRLLDQLLLPLPAGRQGLGGADAQPHRLRLLRARLCPRHPRPLG